MDALLNMQIPLWALLVYMGFNCAVQALPRPAESSSPVYVWAYQFAHLLCANLSLVFDPKKKTPNA